MAGTSGMATREDGVGCPVITDLLNHSISGPDIIRVPKVRCDVGVAILTTRWCGLRRTLCGSSGRVSRNIGDRE
jgi:hypothetical protein